MSDQPLPPYDLDAEESVVGAMLVSPTAIDQVRATGLGAAEFYRRRHSAIYRAICRMVDEGRVVDSITVTAELEQRGQLDEVGGKAMVHTLASTVPAASNAASHAQVIREAAHRRAVIRIASEVSEAALNGGMSGATERLLEVVRAAPAGHQRRYLRTTAELRERPDVDYLVPPVLPEGRGTVLFAARDSYKSFIALDWALTTASGLPWGGEETKPGLVVYLAAEGADGVLRRADAWCALHDVEMPERFWWIDQPVMLNDPAAVASLLADLRALAEPPVLIVVDTYARCLIGNENATEDAAAFVRALDLLRSEFGCAWLLIHHTGNEHPDRERGSTIPGDAADARITVKRDTPASRDVRLVCRKMKDDAPFDDIALRLEPFHDSLVVTMGEPPPAWEPFEETDAKPSMIAEWVRGQPDGFAAPKAICAQFGISATALKNRRDQLALHGIRYVAPKVSGGRAFYTAADPTPTLTVGVAMGSDPEPHTPTGGFIGPPEVGGRRGAPAGSGELDPDDPEYPE